MAIAPTGNIFKTLEFDGESSYQYGVYISGAGVFDAPERDVEMITIPGRNGSFSLDNGRFQNIEVTYPAGIFADTEADFAQAISDFRNFLCSRRGYVRLTDDYNPDEYRMAIYKSGLDVAPAQLKAGQFSITFECKPQRYLMSGEAEIDINSSGDVISNPTLFDSEPLLKVMGYGNIGIGDDVIEISNDELGEIQISNGGAGSSDLDMTNVNTSDSIYQRSNSTYSIKLILRNSAAITELRNSSNLWSASYINDGTTRYFNVSLPLFSCVAGTASSAVSSFQIYFNDTSSGVETTATVTITQAYDGVSTVTLGAVLSGIPIIDPVLKLGQTYSINKFFADSSVSFSTIYIDLEAGEAYGELSDKVYPLNHVVALPAALPTLKPGINVITYDNTITDLKISPRWWKV